MSAEGVFHNAHEVWTRNLTTGPAEWSWIATFATEDLAEVYVMWSVEAVLNGQEFEVRPV